MDSIAEKRCPQCGFVKSFDEYHNNKSARDGKQAYCKVCWNAKVKQHDKDHPEGLTKRTKSYAERNRETLNEKAKSRRKDNPELYKEKDKLYNQTRDREKQRQWQEKYVASNRTYVNARHEAWKRRNPEKVQARDSRRRARELGAEGNFTALEWYDLCVKYHNKCLCCGLEKKLTVDHVIPLVKGGSNWITNIQPLCKSCNSKKKDRAFDYRK